ncbi:hypothetical protein LPJ72_004695 [Coemansia sp. Benny D160-2]|nr:hypothetical protein LPJ72_004695 [Coemansia sp. Benny D160-2]
MKVPFFRNKSGTKNRSLSTSASMATLSTSRSQAADLESFLSTIDSFRTDTRRLFPEHTALDRILGDLRDECKHRVEYMSRVSALSALSTSSSPPMPAQAQAQAQATLSPQSNTNGKHNTSSSAHFSANGASNGNSNSNGNVAATARRRKTTTAPDTMPSPSPSPPQLPAVSSLNRRRNPPHSMFLASLSGDDGPGRPLSLAELNLNSKASLVGAGTLRNSGGGGTRTQHMPATATTAAAAATTATSGAGKTGTSGNEYVLAVKIAGHKVEAAVAPSLQTSLISMQLALMMGMPVTSVSPNSRVWSTSGKSWSTVGEVTGLPFVCGNMTFTHTFKVVQGAAGSNDMPRDVVLGNDFCVGNKGRIKDNRLHLEQLCMPVSVPIRPITAA